MFKLSPFEQASSVTVLERLTVNDSPESLNKLLIGWPDGKAVESEICPTPAAGGHVGLVELGLRVEKSL